MENTGGKRKIPSTLLLTQKDDDKEERKKGYILYIYIYQHTYDG